MTTPIELATRIEVHAIEPAVLSELRNADDLGNLPRLMIDREGGSPLRCCLRPARSGERLALVSYAPLRRWALQTGAEPGPYNEIGPVFIHPEPCAGPAETGYPQAQAAARRVMRAYSADGAILGGRMVEPPAAGQVAAAQVTLAEIFTDPQVAIVHVRAVEYGCFLFEARRA